MTTPSPSASTSFDLRLAPVALSAWLTCAIAVGISPARAMVAAGALGVAVLLLRLRARSLAPGVLTVLISALGVSCAALAVSGLRAGAVQAGPLPGLAADRAYVAVKATVVTDPVLIKGSLGDYALVRVQVSEVVGRGATTHVRTPLLVIGEQGWLEVRLGDAVRIDGRLGSAQGSDLAAVITSRRPPEVLSRASWWMGGIEAVRAGVRSAHAPLPEGPRALLPALVDGDDLGMSEELKEDFRITGLTHLLAVSGSNLTLVLGFVMLVSRWCGVRGRGFVVVGLIAVVFFVVLARPEPSVLRAAAMGVVALAGLSSGGRRRGVRSLCVAVAVLVLIDPWLARSPGFVLSTLATAGILLFSPGWRDCLARWMPRWLAEAIAVPLAAQIVCTPVVAGLSGQVSLVAVVSNLLAAPAVGPATVIGLVSGLVAVVVEPIGQLGGRVAGLPGWWIVFVAERSARLDGASMTWPAGFVALLGLIAVCIGAVCVMPSVLRRAPACVAVMALLALVIVRPGGRLGWPPPDWLMVMCDVGQGDGLVLRAGPNAGVVVDAGPESRSMDRCLDDLEIDHVPLVVLTHFHADHVDGLSGVFDGRQVDQVAVSPLAEPADRVSDVAEIARAGDAGVVAGVVGERRVAGAVTLDFIGPRSIVGVEPNNASLVIAAQVDGNDLLLTGDAEPEEQADLLDAVGDLDTEVLKVPHHGSANVDADFIAATRPDVALVSAGVDNDYGHPAPHLLALLEDLDVPVYRTDLDGDIAIVEVNGTLSVVVTQR